MKAVAERKAKANGHPSSDEELNAERALIGAVVLGVSLVEIRPMLKVGDFAQPVLGAAYAEALKLEAAGIAVDGVTLASALAALPAPAGEGTMLDRINGRAGLGVLTQECPTVRNAGHYARLIAAAAAARAGRPVFIPAAAPIIERIGLGYRASFPAGVDLKVDRLHESRGELTAELSVRWTLPVLPTQDGHIYRGRFNLSGLTARSSAARFLNDRTRGAEIPWSELLERFCIGVLDAHRAGDAFQTVGQREPRSAPARLLDPVLPADAATLLYGPGGSGKSTLAAAIALSVQTGREIIPGWKPLSAPVLVLDWEASADEWNDRLAALSAGNNIAPPAIHYRRMEGSLAERVEELAAFVTEYLIGLIIVDSVGMASGTSRDGSDANESALRLFAALRAIGATSLLVDHVAGAELDKSAAIGKAYGSVYKMNLARAAYELRRENEGSQERTELVLRQAKINDQGKLPAIALAVVYEPGRIRFETTNATAPELIPMANTLPDRITALLRAGSMFAPAIAEQLGLTQETVRAVLSRHRSKRFMKLQDNSWGLVHHE